MSGSQNRWTLRLSTEGADQVVRDLRAAATESAAAARAYDTLIKAQPQLATGADRAEQALRKNVDAMKAMRGELNVLGAAAQGAASSLGAFGTALTSPAAAIAGLTAAAGAGAVQIARLGDEYTNTMNRLRAATGSVQAAGAVYAELVALSQQTGASISESAGAFVRFSVAARAIGATNGEVLQLTRTIQQAGLISGASTQEAASGVMQLGQALASGTLQGDELRSILENMPTLAEALAQQLGVSVGQLRTMGSEGQLTSDRVFQALLRAGENINKQFTELTPTMGRAFGVLGQAMVEFVGKLDQALGLSQAIARAAAGAAAAVGRVSGSIGPSSPAERVEAAEQRLRAMQDQLRQAEEALAEQRRQFIPRNASPSRAAAAERAADQDPLVQEQTQRIARLRQQMAAEGQVIAQARTEQDQAARQADDARQAEEATALARRAAAQRTAQQTAFNSARDALDRERKLREEHAARITAIDAGLANGDTDAAGAARLRRLANDELADGLKALDAAARGRIETDESLAEVMRAVADIERDRQALMREGETLTASVRTEAEKYAEQLAHLNNLLGAGAISQDTYNRAVAAADPAVKAAQEAARRIEQENARTTDRITSFFGDAFARAFEGTGNGFRGLMDSFKRAAISTFSSIAAQAIIRPIIAPIVQGAGIGQLGVGGGGSLNQGGLFGGSPAQAATQGGGGSTDALSSLGTLRQAYNGLTSPGGLGSFFPGGTAFNTGWGGLDGVLNASTGIGATPGIGNVAATYGEGVGAFASGGVSNAAGGAASSGLSFGQMLGPLAAIGGGAFTAYQGIQRGGAGGFTSAAGGAISAGTGLAMLGSAAGLLPALGVLGPIGLGVGAAAALAGAFLPGARPSGRGQLARVDLGRDALSFDGLGGDRFSQGNRDAATSAVQSINALARELGDALGGARLRGTASVGVTNSTLYLDIEGAKGQFANNEEGGKQLAARASEIVLQQFKDQFVREGRTDETAAVLFNSHSQEQLGQNLQWYEQVYKSFNATGEAADKTAQAIKAVEDRFAPLIDKARSLSLSTDAIIVARDKEIDAARKAAAAAEASRQRELASIRTGLQAREAAVANSADYEGRMLAAQTARWQSWGEELVALEQRLTELGETTEATAAATGRLRAVQGAEYWQAFASSMEALDRSVIGRILRANGRSGEADRMDFEAGARDQIAALRVALAELGVSADIAAKKIGETQQAIDAERQARARAANEQIVALDQSVISRILRATGRGAEADLRDLEAAAAREVATLARTLDDLGFSADVVARKIIETEQAIGAERIALQKRIAEEAAAVQKRAAEEAAAALQRLLGAGQSIRSFVDAQRTNTGPGGVSAEEALRNAQGQFGTDLSLARSGDQDALARITSTADRLLGAAERQFASGLDFQAVRSFVLASLESLPATRSYDSLVLEELRKLGGAVNVEVGVAVVRTITEALNVLPPADLARLVQAETVLRTVEQRLGRDLTLPEQNSILQAAVVLRDVQQQLGRDLTATERANIVQAGSALRTVEQAIGRNLTAAERDGIIQAATVQRNVEQALGRALTPAERDLLVEPGMVSRSVTQAVGAPTGAALLQPGVITRTVTQAVETTETIQISRSIDDKLAGILNAQLVIGREQVKILGQINSDTNLLWKAAAGVNQPGLRVNSSDWSHNNTTNIVKFAQGGVFDSPHTFAMAGGRMGVFGEAGPEAIMPLERGPGGRLGVRASGGGTDAMARMIERMAREIAELRAEMRRMVRAGERTADATEDTAATNATMARRDVIVGRRPRAA